VESESTHRSKKPLSARTSLSARCATPSRCRACRRGRPAITSETRGAPGHRERVDPEGDLRPCTSMRAIPALENRHSQTARAPTGVAPSRARRPLQRGRQTWARSTLGSVMPCTCAGAVGPPAGFTTPEDTKRLCGSPLTTRLQQSRAPRSLRSGRGGHLARSTMRGRRLLHRQIQGGPGGGAPARLPRGASSMPRPSVAGPRDRPRSRPSRSMTRSEAVHLLEGRNLARRA